MDVTAKTKSHHECEHAISINAIHSNIERTQFQNALRAVEEDYVLRLFIVLTKELEVALEISFVQDHHHHALRNVTRPPVRYMNG